MGKPIIAALLCIIAITQVYALLDEFPLSKIHYENVVESRVASSALTITPDTLNGTDSWVTVAWSGMGVHHDTWIGVYSPPPSNISAQLPVKFMQLDSSDTGSVQLWFLNMRADYQVAYFKHGLDTPVLLATSNVASFTNYDVPSGIHLAFTNITSQMRVTWTSSKNMFPSLNFGVDPNHLNNSVYAATSTYTASDMCGGVAKEKGWRAPGFLHTAVLKNLSPSTTYYYQVGDESAHSKSTLYSFTSAPQVGPQDIDFFIFGDLGQVEFDHTNEASQMDASINTTSNLFVDISKGFVNPNKVAVVHIGDISYARGYSSLWDQFFYQIEPVASTVAWMTGIGNHERDFPNSGSLWNGTDSGGECGVPYEKRMIMPTNARDQPWYSFTFGPITFVIISTEHDFSTGSQQYEWLDFTLASVDRAITPFLIVAGHRPAYIDSTNDSPGGGDLTTATLLRQYLEEMWVKYEVDACFWGHHHSYQRTCAVFNSTCDSEHGIVHIVTGAAGAGFSTNLNIFPPAWIQFVNDWTHGYTRAHVRGNQLTLDFVSDVDRSILDTVTITSKASKYLQNTQQQHEDEQVIEIALV